MKKLYTKKVILHSPMLAPMPTPAPLPISTPTPMLMPTDHLQLEIVIITQICILKAGLGSLLSSMPRWKVRVRLLAGNTWCSFGFRYLRFPLLSFCFGHEMDLRAHCNDAVHHNSTPATQEYRALDCNPTMGSWLQLSIRERLCRLSGNCVLASAALYVKDLTQNEQAYITPDGVYSIQDAWRHVFPGVVKEGTYCCSSESYILLLLMTRQIRLHVAMSR